MVTNNTINQPDPLPISAGGTNASSFSTSRGIIKYDGTRLVTSSKATLDANGYYTNTGQPAILVYISDTLTNQTGDGTVLKIPFNTELLDQTNSFDAVTNYEFTAPADGIYFFYANVTFTDLAAGFTSYTLDIVTTSYTFTSFGNPGVVRNSANRATFKVSGFVFMNATDTAYVNASVSGGAKTVDILGPTRYTQFWGYKVA